jgi:hypothetical protein
VSKLTVTLSNILIEIDEDTEKQIEELNSKHIIENYLPKFKIALVVIAVWLFALQYFFINFINGENIYVMIVNRIRIAVVFWIVGYLWIHFYPKKYAFLIPIKILVIMEELAAFWVNNEAYPISESSLPWISIWFSLILIAPSQARGNWIAFFLGWAYFLIRLHVERNMLEAPFITTALFSFGYFTMSSIISYTNLKSLNKQVYVNQLQAKEIKMLLEIFPHGVIINSGDQENDFKVHFTNKEFEEKIGKIRNNVEELQKIEIIGDKEEAKIDLHEFLVSKQIQLVNDKVNEQKKLAVKWGKRPLPMRRVILSDDNQDEEEIKIFTVKSMKVSWEGKPCYMHVFYINNEILKLEEAKNNIKLQKIMFASVSHEFRTPLNAIIHSYNLMKTSFEKLMNVVQDIIEKQK